MPKGKSISLIYLEIQVLIILYKWLIYFIYQKLCQIIFPHKTPLPVTSYMYGLYVAYVQPLALEEVKKKNKKGP